MDRTEGLFTYDGNGKRVKSVINPSALPSVAGQAPVTTYFVGAHYEVAVTATGTQVSKYYYTGAQRIAVRNGSGLFYLLGDHLGSTSLTVDAAGSVVSELRYKAWGEVQCWAKVFDLARHGSDRRSPQFVSIRSEKSCNGEGIAIK